MNSTIKPRVDSVDFLRGLVMVLMVLDHCREFFMPRPEPTDLASTTVLLFFTRWVTHFCAPIFVFLAGAGSYLAHASGKLATRGALADYLVSRGLFLMVLEVTVIYWGWHFNFSYRVVLLAVIWAIGFSMVLLAALVACRLSSRAIGLFGLAILVGHNIFDLPAFAFNPPDSSVLNIPWKIFCRPGAVRLESGRMFILAYSVIPWFGVMAAGFAFGEILNRERIARMRTTGVLGLAICVLFVMLRWNNHYGDPTPWSSQDTAAKTVLSFLNCQKYPPSLMYLSMTLGPGLLILAGYDLLSTGAAAGWLPQRLIELGRAPLLYYILQWPLIHMMANVTSLFSGQSIPWNVFAFEYPPTYGYSLPVVYVAWVVAVAVLYFPTTWFAAYKRRHRDSIWLIYL